MKMYAIDGVWCHGFYFPEKQMLTYGRWRISIDVEEYL